MNDERRQEIVQQLAAIAERLSQYGWCLLSHSPEDWPNCEKKAIETIAKEPTKQ